MEERGMPVEVDFYSGHTSKLHEPPRSIALGPPTNQRSGQCMQNLSRSPALTCGVDFEHRGLA